MASSLTSSSSVLAAITTSVGAIFPAIALDEFYKGKTINVIVGFGLLLGGNREVSNALFLSGECPPAKNTKGDRDGNGDHLQQCRGPRLTFDSVDFVEGDV